MPRIIKSSKLGDAILKEIIKILKEKLKQLFAYFNPELSLKKVISQLRDQIKKIIETLIKL